jgi:hypothetical protein
VSLLRAIASDIIDELCTAEQLRRRRRARWADSIPYRIERELYMRGIGARGTPLTTARLRRIAAGIHRVLYEAMTARNARVI